MWTSWSVFLKVLWLIAPAVGVVAIGTWIWDKLSYKNEEGIGVLCYVASIVLAFAWVIATGLFYLPSAF